MNIHRNHTIFSSLLILSLALAGISCQRANGTADLNNPYQSGLQKLEYNNPGLLVDLDVGFKSDPLPMDFDGDGDYDLLISESSSYTESGVFYFENISGNQDFPIFRYGMKVSTERFRQGYDGMCFEVSEVDGRTHVITPDRVNDNLLIYRDVPQNVFWDRSSLPLPASTHIENTRSNAWKMVDFDGDGVADLMCGLNTRVSGSYLLFFKNSGTNGEPVYEDPIQILTEKGDPIGSTLRLEVLLADFDSDGDLDYIGVSRFAGFVYFENRGTPEMYSYAEGKPLMKGPEKLQMFSSYGHAIKATAIDWNRDGHMDIIAGDEDGKVSLLKNTGQIKNGAPEFLAPSFFQQEAKYVDFGALTAPRIIDWDGDGLDDIVSGNGIGSIGFIKNLGGGMFQNGQPLSFSKLLAKRSRSCLKMQIGGIPPLTWVIGIMINCPISWSITIMGMYCGLKIPGPGQIPCWLKQNRLKSIGRENHKNRNGYLELYRVMNCWHPGGHLHLSWISTRMD